VPLLRVGSVLESYLERVRQTPRDLAHGHNVRRELLWLDNSSASYPDADVVAQGVYERVYLHLAPPARHLAHARDVYGYVLRLPGGFAIALGVQLDAPALAHRVNHDVLKD
jgi:hypothetical protein